MDLRSVQRSCIFLCCRKELCGLESTGYGLAANQFLQDVYEYPQAGSGVPKIQSVTTIMVNLNLVSL